MAHICGILVNVKAKHRKRRGDMKKNRRRAASSKGWHAKICVWLPGLLHECSQGWLQTSGAISHKFPQPTPSQYPNLPVTPHVFPPIRRDMHIYIRIYIYIYISFLLVYATNVCRSEGKGN